MPDKKVDTPQEETPEEKEETPEEKIAKTLKEAEKAPGERFRQSGIWQQQPEEPEFPPGIELQSPLTAELERNYDIVGIRDRERKEAEAEAIRLEAEEKARREEEAIESERWGILGLSKDNAFIKGLFTQELKTDKELIKKDALMRDPILMRKEMQKLLEAVDVESTDELRDLEDSDPTKWKKLVDGGFYPAYAAQKEMFWDQDRDAEILGLEPEDTLEDAFVVYEDHLRNIMEKEEYAIPLTAWKGHGGIDVGQILADVEDYYIEQVGEGYYDMTPSEKAEIKRKAWNEVVQKGTPKFEGHKVPFIWKDDFLHNLKKDKVYWDAFNTLAGTAYDVAVPEGTKAYHDMVIPSGSPLRDPAGVTKMLIANYKPEFVVIQNDEQGNATFDHFKTESTGNLEMFGRWLDPVSPFIAAGLKQRKKGTSWEDQEQALLKGPFHVPGTIIIPMASNDEAVEYIYHGGNIVYTSPEMGAYLAQGLGLEGDPRAELMLGMSGTAATVMLVPDVTAGLLGPTAVVSKSVAKGLKVRKLQRTAVALDLIADGVKASPKADDVFLQIATEINPVMRDGVTTKVKAVMDINGDASQVMLNTLEKSKRARRAHETLQGLPSELELGAKIDEYHGIVYKNAQKQRINKEIPQLEEFKNYTPKDFEHEIGQLTKQRDASRKSVENYYKTHSKDLSQLEAERAAYGHLETKYELVRGQRSQAFLEADKKLADAQGLRDWLDPKAYEKILKEDKALRRFWNEKVDNIEDMLVDKSAYIAKIEAKNVKHTESLRILYKDVEELDSRIMLLQRGSADYAGLGTAAELTNRQRIMGNAITRDIKRLVKDEVITQSRADDIKFAVKNREKISSVAGFKNWDDQWRDVTEKVIRREAASLRAVAQLVDKAPMSDATLGQRAINKALRRLGENHNKIQPNVLAKGLMTALGEDVVKEFAKRPGPESAIIRSVLTSKETLTLNDKALDALQDAVKTLENAAPVIKGERQNLGPALDYLQRLESPWSRENKLGVLGDVERWWSKKQPRARFGELAPKIVDVLEGHERLTSAMLAEIKLSTRLVNPTEAELIRILTQYVDSTDPIEATGGVAHRVQQTYLNTERQLFGAGREYMLSVPSGKGLSDRAIRNASLAWTSGGDRELRDAIVVHGMKLLQDNEAQSFGQFMEKMKDFTISKGLTPGDAVEAYANGAISFGDAAIMDRSLTRVRQAMGGVITPDEMKTMNAIMSGNMTDVSDVDAAYAVFRRLGMPYGVDSLEAAEKAGKMLVVANKISDDGLYNIVPRSIITDLEAATRRALLPANLREGANASQGWVGVQSMIRGWKRGVTTGMLLPRRKYWWNNLFGDMSQIWWDEGIVKSGKLTFQNMWTNLPGGTGRKVQNVMLEANAKMAEGLAARGHTKLAGVFESILNPHLGRIFSGREGSIRLPGGQVKTYRQLSLEMIEDGVMDSYVEQEFIQQLNKMVPKEYKKAVALENAGNVRKTLRQIDMDIAEHAQLVQQRQRAGLYLDYLQQGKTREEATAAVKNALYDWSHGLARWEVAAYANTIPFYRFWKLAMGQGFRAIAEPFLTPTADYMMKAARGQTKLARGRQQIQLARAIPEMVHWHDPSVAPKDQQELYDMERTHIHSKWMDPYMHWVMPSDREAQEMYKESYGKNVESFGYVAPPATALEIMQMYGVIPYFLMGFVNSAATGEEDYYLRATMNSITDKGLDFVSPHAKYVFQNYRDETKNPFNVKVSEGYYWTFRGLDAATLNQVGFVGRNDQGQPTVNAAWLRMMQLVPFMVQIPADVSAIATADWQEGVDRGMTDALYNLATPVRRYPIDQEATKIWREKREMRKIRSQNLAEAYRRRELDFRRRNDEED